MQKKLRKDRQGCTRIYSGVAWLGFRDGKVGLEREGTKRKNHCLKIRDAWEFVQQTF